MLDNNLWAIGWLTVEPWYPPSPHIANTWSPSRGAFVGFPPRSGRVTLTGGNLVAGRQVPVWAGSELWDGDYAAWKVAFPPNGGGWW